MLITVKEASNFTGFAEKTIYEMIKNGQLEQFKEGTIKVDKEKVLLSIPTVFASINQKGGVGKTTSAVLFADYLEKRNIKTLIIDLDQQTNISQVYFDINKIMDTYSIYDYFEDHTPLNKIIMNYSEYIDVIPANLKLAKKYFLDTPTLVKSKEDFFTIFKKYQVVLIDCPPALNSFSQLGILLSNYALIPLQEEQLCYFGLTDILDTITAMKGLNRDFIDFLAFSSRHKGQRSIIQDNMRDAYKQTLGKKYIENYIPDFVGVTERMTAKVNIFDMCSQSQTEKITQVFDDIYNIAFEERTNG